jgi:hypothetical protein
LRQALGPQAENLDNPVRDENLSIPKEPRARLELRSGTASDTLGWGGRGVDKFANVRLSFELAPTGAEFLDNPVRETNLSIPKQQQH